MTQETPSESRVAVDALLLEICDAIPDMVLVLDDQRQAIAANRHALAVLGKPKICSSAVVRGNLWVRRRRRVPGRVRNQPPLRALRRPSGDPGLPALRETSSREARILVCGATVAALDLLVTTSPATVGCRPLTVCILRDISDQKRLAILENLFFHDVLNTAGGSAAWPGILADTSRILSPDREMDCRQGMARLSRRLIDEILHQRDLLAAERGVFEARMEQIDLTAMLREVCALYAEHPVARKRFLAPGGESVGTVRSDETILRRVVGNLVKNALEATAEGGTVRTSWRDLGDQVVLQGAQPRRHSPRGATADFPALLQHQGRSG